MVIEKVHGLHATSVSLNERFTMLANAAPDRVANVAMRQKRRASMGSVLARNYNMSNQYLVEQVARRLELEARRQALRQRLRMGQTGLRRFGSDGNLPGLRRANSFGNLSQQNVKNRLSWRQSNGNLSRSSSFSNLNNAIWRARTLRGFRRRGGGQRGRGRGRGRGQRRVGVMSRGATQLRTQTRPGPRGQGTRARGRGRGRGRGAVTRSQSQMRKLLSKEELDAQLDQYMACTKSALDQELDNYMKNAMEME